MSVINTSMWTQQNRNGYSTKTVSGKQIKRESSKHELKQRSNNQQNMSQFTIAKNNTPKQTTPSQQRTSIPPKSKTASSTMQKLDNDFVQLLSQVQVYYTKLTKHQQIRVQKWIVKIIQKDETLRWKQNRNNYLKLLYHIVRQNEYLLQPFDKIPDQDKDVPYLSQHQYCMRTKSRNDSKLSVFHPFKPQIIKINQPQGDSCSVLMSLVNTARTVKDKENAIVLEQCQDKLNKEILNTKILDGQIKESQLIECSQGYSQHYYKTINESGLSIEGKNGSINGQVKFSSSAIPSNLPSCNPSQVKQLLTPFSHSNHSFLFSKNESGISKSRQEKQVSVSKSSKQRVQNYKNHSKYSIKSEGLQTSNILNNKKKSINSQQYLHIDKMAPQSPSSQLRVCNDLVLTMGKLLLKNESAIQSQSEYWQLLRMIYSYHQSSTINFNNKHNNRSKSHHYQNSQQSVNSFGTDVSFQQFISRLKQQVSLNIKQQAHTSLESKNISSNKITSNLDPSSLVSSSKNQQFVSTNKRPSHVSQHPPKQQMNKNFINNNQAETMNHITEQSLDFKVEEGVESEDMLYYEWGNRRRQSQAKQEVEVRGSQHVVGGQRMSVECQAGIVNNEQRLQSSQHMSNSLMQISDSYRQIRRHNNHNQKQQPPKTYLIASNPNAQDYHNVYDEPSEQQDEISFTDKQLIDEEQDEGESEEIEVECGNDEDEEGKQQEDNPLFTEDEEDSQCDEEDYVLGEEQQLYYDDDDEAFYHAQPKQSPN